mmetsp:Transcript_52993/g.114623  ORF Transcript_52993/g.114623 Transcript_52993/m.114623 type:complete len:207 (+) Transcript_52993:1119-1739(+)
MTSKSNGPHRARSARAAAQADLQAQRRRRKPLWQLVACLVVASAGPQPRRLEGQTREDVRSSSSGLATSRMREPPARCYKPAEGPCLPPAQESRPPVEQLEESWLALRSPSQRWDSQWGSLARLRARCAASRACPVCAATRQSLDRKCKRRGASSRSPRPKAQRPSALRGPRLSWPNAPRRGRSQGEVPPRQSAACSPRSLGRALH